MVVLGWALLSLFCFLCVFLRGGRFPVEPWTRLHCSELYWRYPVVVPAVQSGAPECSKACPHGSLCGFSVLLWHMAHSVGEWLCLNLQMPPVHPVLSTELAGTMTPSDSCLSIWCWRSEPPHRDRFCEQVLQQCECDLCVPSCSFILEVLTSPISGRNIICLSWPY